MKVIRTRKPKSSMIMRLGFLAVAGYVAVSLFSLQMEINASEADLRLVQEQIKAEDARKSELERQIAMAEGESNLARIARDRLGMSFPDEHIYQDISGT